MINNYGFDVVWSLPPAGQVLTWDYTKLEGRQAGDIIVLRYNNLGTVKRVWFSLFGTKFYKEYLITGNIKKNEWKVNLEYNVNTPRRILRRIWRNFKTVNRDIL